MIKSDKLFLHHVIDVLSVEELAVVVKMFKGFILDTNIDELPIEEVPKHLKILEEMNAGDYINLDDLQI